MSPNAPVAQLDRALPSEGKGHTFESCRVRQQIQAVRNSTANPGPSRPYPLQIPRCLYRERDPVRLRKAERFNALAERLEQHINSQVEKSNDRIQIFYCGGIALDLRIDEKEVAGRLPVILSASFEQRSKYPRAASGSPELYS